MDMNSNGNVIYNGINPINAKKLRKKATIANTKNITGNSSLMEKPPGQPVRQCNGQFFFFTLAYAVEKTVRSDKFVKL